MAAEERIIGKVGKRTTLLVMQQNRGIVTPYATKQWDDDAYDEAVEHHGKLAVIRALNRCTKIDDRTKAAGKKGKFADAIRGEVTLLWAKTDPDGLAKAKSLSGFDSIPDVAEWKRRVDTHMGTLDASEIHTILVKVGMAETTEPDETDETDDELYDDDDENEN